MAGKPCRVTVYICTHKIEPVDEVVIRAVRHVGIMLPVFLACSFQWVQCGLREKLRTGVETTCKRNGIFVEKGENGKRQNTKDDLPHKMKRKIHFLRSLQRRDGILKPWRMMTVNFVVPKCRIKRGYQSFSLMFQSIEFQKLHVRPHNGDGVHISADYLQICVTQGRCL